MKQEKIFSVKKKSGEKDKKIVIEKCKKKVL